MKFHRPMIVAAVCGIAWSSGSVWAAGEGARMSGSNATPPFTMSDTTSSVTSSGIAASIDSATVRQVQQALSSKGHDPGPIDGVMGARTRSALQAYQSSHNLSGDTGIDQRTLESLGVRASASRSLGGNAGVTESARGRTAAPGGPAPGAVDRGATPSTQNPTGITPGTAPR